jgi:disulfide bond formation protein DsbB
MQSASWLRGHRVAVNLVAAVACFCLYAYALYAEHRLELEPCPLCIFQRVGVIAMGVAFVASALLALPRRTRWAGFVAIALILVAAAAAAGVAGRHVYIQSLPPGRVEACGASLQWMLEINTLGEVIRKVLTASGECAKVDWKFLGLSMPGWVLAWALLLGALGIVVNWPVRRAGGTG